MLLCCQSKVCQVICLYKHYNTKRPIVKLLLFLEVDFIIRSHFLSHQQLAFTAKQDHDGKHLPSDAKEFQIRAS